MDGNFKFNIPKGFIIVAEERGENWEIESEGEEGEYHYILQYEYLFVL